MRSHKLHHLNQRLCDLPRSQPPCTPKFASSWFVGLLVLSTRVLANPYDDCILQNMGTAQNEAAVYAIERACINKASVPIPPDDKFAGALNANAGDFNTGHGSLEHGLVVTMKNTTNYSITEVVVSILHKGTQESTRYTVSSFNAPLPPGAIISKLGEPALTRTIKPGETRRFFVHIDEVLPAHPEFTKKFAWDVMPTKGIPAN